MKIILKGNPLSTQHIYGTSGRRRFMYQDAVNLKTSYCYDAKRQWKGKPIEGDINLKIDLFFGDKRKRDWDNFHKLTMDALTNIVYFDDSQIQTALVSKKYDKDNPRTEITVL